VGKVRFRIASMGCLPRSLPHTVDPMVQFHSEIAPSKMRVDLSLHASAYCYQRNLKE
jgi:hypothetical protein